MEEWNSEEYHLPQVLNAVSMLKDGYLPAFRLAWPAVIGVV
jgi:hypothetical protein